MSIEFSNIILGITFLLMPALIIHFAGKYLLLRKAGNVVIAYAIGLIIGNSGIIPEGSFDFHKLIVDISIVIALPLLLMSLDVKGWTKLAGKTFLSLISGLASMIIFVVIGFFIFKNIIPETWKVSGMLVGVYSGGTPNLASIQTALKIPAETYIFVHSADLIVSAVFLLFLMTSGRAFFNRLLPYGYLYQGRFDNSYKGLVQFENYSEFFQSYNLIPSLKSLGASLLILGLGFLISLAFGKEYETIIIILIITTLGIAASFVPDLNEAPKNFEMGMYFILVFSLAVAAMADLSKFSMEALPLLAYVAFVIFGALFLHALLSRIFHSDADTLMITATALICSPPFVPLIAGTLNNKQIIISGLSVGIIGYAVGNYLGVFIALLLKLL